MRKGRDGGKKNRGGKKQEKEKTGKKKKKRLMIIVATTSLPAVDRPNAGMPHARANNSQNSIFVRFWTPFFLYFNLLKGALMILKFVTKVYGS